MRLRNATQTPRTTAAGDPGDGRVTENLGFGVTSNLSYEPPYTFARRMSTLDISRGRIGWNVVTGYLDSAPRCRQAKADAHDDRTMSPTNIWKWSTSSGKELEDERRCAIARAAFSPTLRRCIGPDEANNYRSTPFT